MRFDENFNVSLSLNPKREMIKVMKKYLLVSLLALLAFVGKAQEDNSDIVKVVILCRHLRLFPTTGVSCSPLR